MPNHALGTSGAGSTLKALYCPVGGAQLPTLRAGGVLQQVSATLLAAAAYANAEAQAARQAGYGPGGALHVLARPGCDAQGGAAQGWRTGLPIARVELLAIEYPAGADPGVAAAQAARWLRPNRTAAPVAGLLLLGQGVVGGAAAVAAAAADKSSGLGTNRASAVIVEDAAPSLRALYRALFPLAAWALGSAYSTPAYELAEGVDAAGIADGGGGALGALMLPRPAGACIADPFAVSRLTLACSGSPRSAAAASAPPCPAVRLLAVNSAGASALVAGTSAKALFVEGEWGLADLSADARHPLPVQPPGGAWHIVGAEQAAIEARWAWAWGYGRTERGVAGHGRQGLVPHFLRELLKPPFGV